MHLLRPSAGALVTVAPPLGHAFKEGAVNLRRRHRAEHAPRGILRSAGQVRRKPGRQTRLRRLHPDLEVGNPVLAGIAPEQAKCNYWTLAFRNVASLESENIGVGTVARAGFVISPGGPNNEGFPSSAPANGGSTENAEGAKGTGPIIDNNHLHVNPYPNVSGPGQRQVCEAGKTAFVPAQAVIGNAPASKVSSGAANSRRARPTCSAKTIGSTSTRSKALGVKK